MENKEFENYTPEALDKEYEAAQDLAQEMQEDVEKAVGTFEASAAEAVEAVEEAVEAAPEAVEAAAEAVQEAIPDGPVNLTEQWQKEHYGESGRKPKADEAAAAAAAAAAAVTPEPAFEQPKYQQQFEQPQYQQDYVQQQYQQPNYQQDFAGYDPYGMQPFGNDKTMGIIGYITLIGFLIALFAGGSNGRRSPYLNFHLNQSLIIIVANFIAGIISGISATIGGVLSLVIFIFWIMAIVGAAKGQTKPLPGTENIKLIKY